MFFITTPMILVYPIVHYLKTSILKPKNIITCTHFCIYAISYFFTKTIRRICQTYREIDQSGGVQEEGERLFVGRGGLK